ncbi:5-methylcytosine restriction system specificity protein McrC [Salinigranum sp. GCM10025319]|uniref:5-methylcytosine restriction system specificity protein McrC n=1 Tax=Salinigranum sp. GCM10025319 TaxID=3252687 RepID=UPI00361A89DD
MKSLHEYGDPVFFEGDPVDLATAFERASEQWAEKIGSESVFDVKTKDEGVTVKAKGVLGQITVQGHQLEIAPKYIPDKDIGDWREAVFDILRFSQSTQFGFTGPATGTFAKESFIDILARGFLESLEPELDKGSPTEYQRTTCQSETVEGKLIPDRLYPQILIDPTRVWVESSQLTSNTILGRSLRFATRRFAAMTSVPELRGRLLELDKILSDADPTAPSLSAINRYYLPPQYRPFADAFEIASWLIREQGAGLGGATMSVEGLLLKSHSVYQSFVQRSLEQVAYKRNWTVEPEPTITVARGPKNVPAFPDHVLKTEDLSVILDSKYKGSTDIETGGKAAKSAPNASDVYQIVMAGRAMGAEDVALVYPAETPDDIWVVSGTGLPHRIRMITLDPIEFYHNREKFFNDLSDDLLQFSTE